MKKDNDNSEKIHIGLTADMNKMVPKMCTGINVSLLNSKKNVILTMMYGDENEGATLIERIAIDIDHVASLRDVLSHVLEEAEYVQNK